MGPQRCSWLRSMSPRCATPPSRRTSQAACAWPMLPPQVPCPRAVWNDTPWRCRRRAVRAIDVLHPLTLSARAPAHVRPRGDSATCHDQGSTAQENGLVRGRRASSSRRACRFNNRGWAGAVWGAGGGRCSAEVLYYGSAVVAAVLEKPYYKTPLNQFSCCTGYNIFTD